MKSQKGNNPDPPEKKTTSFVGQISKRRPNPRGSETRIST